MIDQTIDVKNKASSMEQYYIFLSLGVTGFSIVLSLNLFAWLVLDKAAANPLSSAWGSNWFPSYSVWLICLALGGVFWMASSWRRTH